MDNNRRAHPSAYTHTNNQYNNKHAFADHACHAQNPLAEQHRQLKSSTHAHTISNNGRTHLLTMPAVYGILWPNSTDN